MENPSVVPAVTITLDGEVRVLKLGFRALKELGVNPFKGSAIAEFIDGMDLDKAAQLVRACLLHEYAKRGSRHGQEPPTVDDIVDMLDFELFEGTLGKLFQAAGLVGEPGAESAAAGGAPDPLTA